MISQLRGERQQSRYLFFFSFLPLLNMFDKLNKNIVRSGQPGGRMCHLSDNKEEIKTEVQIPCSLDGEQLRTG